MLSSPGNVESSQVHAKLFTGFLKQMVGHFLGYGGVKCLSHLVINQIKHVIKSKSCTKQNLCFAFFYLINKSHHVGICPSRLVEIVGLLQHFG